jgi:hypothetical protein
MMPVTIGETQGIITENLTKELIGRDVGDGTWWNIFTIT